MIEYRLPESGGIEYFGRSAWHFAPGCSLAGVFKFREYIKEMYAVMSSQSGEETIETLLNTDKRFRKLFNTCLTLNGVELDTVRPYEAIDLLLPSFNEDGEVTAAPLDVLNRPDEPQYPGKGEPLSTQAQLTAWVAVGCGSVSEALKLAEEVPMKQLLGIVEAKMIAEMSPEEREKADFDRWKNEVRANLRKGRKPDQPIV